MGIEKLDRYINNESLTVYENYTLENIINLMAALGDPQESLNIIHIAGTNGKGSVAFMLNSIFIEAGYKTGLFTSPHLLRINERIKINNREISDSDLDLYSDESCEIINKSPGMEPTFFDIITQIALKYFRDNNTDIVILEAGLGGRLDSTNIVNPLVSIITDISLDHISTLGDNINSIVSEKAGIIKEMTPLVTTNTDNEIVEFLAEKAKEKNADFFSYGRNFRAEEISRSGTALSYNYSFGKSGSNRKIPGVTLNTYADFQVRNSSAAITAALLLEKNFQNIRNHEIITGLAGAEIPGRFQVLSDDPLVIFDPAHNREALRSIVEILKKHFALKKIVIVVTLMKDKDCDEIFRAISEIADLIIYYQLDDPRGYRPSREEGFQKFSAVVENEDELLKELEKMREESMLFFFTGSFRLYKIASESAEKLKNDNPG